MNSSLPDAQESRINQLENKCKTLQQTNSNLQQECKILRQTNSIILQRQLEGEAKIALLEQKLELLREASLSEYVRKAKYQEVVKKNQDYEYPVAMPSIEEIMSQGFNEQDATEIHEDIAAMVEQTKNMRSGEAMNYIDPNPIGSIYYDGYLPHYKEFVDALIEYRHTMNYRRDVRFKCSMGSMELTRDVLAILQDGFYHAHFDSMTIYSNLEVTVDRLVGYIDFIANCVAASTRLIQLDLNQIFVENTRDMDVLCEGINSNISLEHLTLDECGNEHGLSGEILSKLKSKTLKSVAICTDLSNLGPTDMSEFLSSNPSLTALDLCSNPFNRQDIVYIADALRHNTTLLNLELSWDNISNHCHLLESAIFDRASLNAAYESNHHCKIKIWGCNISSDIEKFNTYSDAIRNRNKKIYTILSTRNRNRENAAYFESDDIGIKHIPRIISLLKPLSRHNMKKRKMMSIHDDTKPLSIVYEIMRDWKMPELYNLDAMNED
eukprot:scaffold32223_cov83-Cyclotella_meneghiniana.AAC.5